MDSLFDTTYSKTRFQGLDILRSLAIIFVFMSHYSLITHINPFGIFNQLGGIGVLLFFVLSGYLIGNQIFSPVSKNEHFSFKKFYIRRFLRTLPSYYFIITIYFLIPQIHERPITVPFWKFLTFTMNYGLHGGGFSHAWSLCVEEHFYILFPLIFIFFLKTFDKKFCFYLLSCILFTSIFLRVFSYFAFVKNTGTEEPLNSMIYLYFPTHTKLDSLAFGMTSSFLKCYYKPLWYRITQLKISNFYLIFGITGICCSRILWRFENLKTFNSIFNDTIVALSCFLLLLAALSTHSLLYKITIPGATKVATWSYAIYLSHKITLYLNFQFFSKYFTGYSDSIFCVSSSIIISLLGGWLLYTLVELPFLNLRDRLTVPPKATPPLSPFPKNSES